MIIHRLPGGSKKIAGYAVCYNNGLLYYTNNINNINRNNLNAILEINSKFNDYRHYYKEYFPLNLREENEEALQFKYSKANWFSNFGYVNINQPSCSSNVINMYKTYYDADGLIGNPVCGPNVLNMAETYYWCQSLTGNPVCGPNVTNMAKTYYWGYGLTGSPACGDNVIDMAETYYTCYGLTNSPVCGNNVTNMYRTYMGCYNLTGNPICSTNTINMSGTYWSCYNLTGSPVCGNNVINMSSAYRLCRNIMGPPVCGSNVIDISNTYYECYNAMKGDAYFYSKNIINTAGCFYGKSGSSILNIFVYNNSTTLNHLLYTNTNSIFGESCSWSNDLSSNGYYYCNERNVYIYPVENIEVRSIFLEIKPQYTFLIDSEESITIPYSFAIDNYEIQAISSNNNVLQINESRIENDKFIVSFSTKNIEANCSITLTAINLNNQEIITTDILNISIIPEPQVSYVVEPLTNVTYGFVLNANGYYESQNKRIGNSYSLCKVNIISDGNTTLYVDCINYAESSFDYGILSALNQTLSSSSTADSTYFTSFQGKQSASVQTVNYGIIPKGEHFIYIKYRKDGSVDSNNDSLQFKIRLE